MPTVIERINVSVSTDGLDASLGAQVEQIQQVVTLIQGLIEDPPDDVGDFLDLASNLPLPEFAFEGDFASALSGARDALPADLGDLTGVIDGNLGALATLVSEQLQPLLEDAVQVAAHIESLVSMDFRCDGAGTGPVASTPPPGGGGGGAPAEDPPPNPGAERLAGAAGQIQQVNDLLDTLPADLTPGGTFELLFGLADVKSRNAFAQLYLPVVDDIIEPLRTLNRWQGLSADAIAAELAATISLLSDRLRAATTAPVDSLGTELGALVPQLDLPALTTFSNGYQGALDALVSALEANDLPATSAPLAALNGAIDGLAATLAAWDGGVAEQASVAVARARGLCDDVMDETSHLLTALEPVDFPRQAVALIPPPRAPDPETVAAAQEAVQPVIDWLEELISLLDFSALHGEVGAVATQAQAMADDIEQGLTGVAVQVQGLFDDLAGQLTSLDLGAVQAQANDEIDGFGARLRSSLERGFAPASSAISDAVQQLSAALDGFDPEDIVEALREVLSAITSVLEGGEVQGAVNQIRDAIAQVTEALEQLSFAPVTDEVVALIEQMTDALRTLIDTELNDAAKTALSAAMSVLPDTLEPVTEPLVEEFDKLLRSEAVPLLERVADKPAELLGEITRFQPADLIGERLSAPFDQALDQAEAFSPGALLAEAESILDEAKSSLVDAARPSRALEVVEEPFNRLREEITRYSPDQLLAPLEARIENAVAEAVEASPVDEIFAQVNRVFAVIEAGLDVPRNTVATLERVESVLAGFASSGAQIDGWRDAMLDKVASVVDLSSVNAALGSARDAVTDAAHAALLSRIETSLQDARDTLESFDPGRRLSLMVSAHGRARALLSALPASTERTDALAALDRLDPSRLAPLRTTQQLHEALTQISTCFHDLSEEWQALMEGADSPLSELAVLSADAAGLRTLLANAVEPVLAPVRYLFSLLENLQPSVAAIAATVRSLLDELTSGVAALLTGPASLRSISEALQQVVDVLRNIDLGFLREGLQTLFVSVLDQLDALNPAALGATLDEAFTLLVDSVNIDSVIPSGAVATLDAEYGQVLDKLRALDPQALVTEVVQPEYEATVVPLVEAFDLTPAFNALIEFMEGLGEELSTELGRVNGAYQNLRAARPEGGLSINVNVGL